MHRIPAPPAGLNSHIVNSRVTAPAGFSAASRLGR